jgi:phosphodiesterase/alkaline phosphatase D-like protein
MSKDKATLVAMTMTFTFLSLGSLAFTLLLLLLLNYYPAYAQQKDNNDIDKVSSITDGIASGDVRDHSALVWSRANTQALLLIPILWS